MLQQTLVAMATEFAATLLRTLRAAPLDELAELLEEQSDAPAMAPASEPRASDTATVTATPARKPARLAQKRRVAQKTEELVTLPPTPPDDSAARVATLAFYAERGAKGATSRQVSEHLAGLGLDAGASERVVDALAADGLVRDAGFRRAAGRNATAAVYVACATSNG